MGATAATVAAIGSTTYTIPGNCPAIAKNGVTYFNCNGVWYEPHYVGTGVTYTVVAAPV